MKRKIITIEYNIEQSPFYDKNVKLRASLEELRAGEGEDVVLARKRYFKQDEYVKFIIGTELDITKYDNLSSTAKTVLFYILYYCLEYNTPTFRLKMSDIGTIINKDESTLFKAIKELIDNKDISRTRTKEVYWINHNRYYKGNYIVDKFLKQN
jgi:hypothetical protein